MINRWSSSRWIRSQGQSQGWYSWCSFQSCQSLRCWPTSSVEGEEREA